MSKTLILRDEIFEYPETGNINYGEEATGWAEEATEEVSCIASGEVDIVTIRVTEPIGVQRSKFIRFNFQL